MTDERSGIPGGEEFDPAEAFSALGHPTRLDILFALWEVHQEGLKEKVSFEDLREYIGINDSGRFNYHLSELVGKFVKQTDDGYSLRHAGVSVVGSLLEGSYAPGEEIAVDTEGECPECDGNLRFYYRDERARVSCIDCDHCISEYGCPPGVLAGRVEARIPPMFDNYLRTVLMQARSGICPNCSGPMETTVKRAEEVRLNSDHPDSEDQDNPIALLHCDRCGERIKATLARFLLDSPAVVGFLHRHDIDSREMLAWQVVGKVKTEVDIRTESPYRVLVKYRAGDGELVLEIDETGRVISSDTI